MFAVEYQDHTGSTEARQFATEVEAEAQAFVYATFTTSPVRVTQNGELRVSIRDGEVTRYPYVGVKETELRANDAAALGAKLDTLAAALAALGVK